MMNAAMPATVAITSRTVAASLISQATAPTSSSKPLVISPHRLSWSVRLSSLAWLILAAQLRQL
jgi:hypothetical protein